MGELLVHMTYFVNIIIGRRLEIEKRGGQADPGIGGSAAGRCVVGLKPSLGIRVRLDTLGCRI